MANDNLIQQVENSDKKKAAEVEEKPQYVLHTYKNRLRFVKEGHLYASREDFVNAVGSYQNYLEALALFYGTTQDKLRPTHFTRGDEDVPEQMMISLVYWELAKIFDRNNKTQVHLKNALDQFVRFTLNYKYQYLNAENIRKYINKGACIHAKVFEDAHKRIQVNSKKCFVATFTLGEGHQDLETFYAFRDKILPYDWGQIFVQNYYRYSPVWVEYFERHGFLGKTVRTLLKPTLCFFAKIMRKTII